MSKTYALFVTEDWYFMSHRLPLAKALKEQGNRVIVCTNINEQGDAIRELGFETVDLGIKRNAISPGNFWKFYKIEQQIRQTYRPDLIINVAIYILLATVLANLFTGQKKMHILTGMGYIFTDDTPVNRVIRFCCSIYFRLLSLFSRHSIVVQNGDDLGFFARHGFQKDRSLHLIAGSGVDCQKFTPPAQPHDAPVVTCVTRMLESKGVYELIEAARFLKEKKNRTYKIMLVGPTDAANPQCLEQGFLEDLNEQGILEWVGPQKDIARIYQESALAVLPSWREGMPKSLLEAAACGLPLVSYDVTGCRDVVKNGENGLTVAFKDIEALANAIETIMENQDLRHKLGQKSREFALVKFSDQVIAGRFLDVIDQQVAHG